MIPSRTAEQLHPDPGTAPAAFGSTVIMQGNQPSLRCAAVEVEESRTEQLRQAVGLDLIEGGAARSGRRKVRPHAHPAAPLSHHEDSQHEAAMNSDDDHHVSAAEQAVRLLRNLLPTEPKHRSQTEVKQLTQALGQMLEAQTRLRPIASERSVQWLLKRLIEQVRAEPSAPADFVGTDEQAVWLLRQLLRVEPHNHSENEVKRLVRALRRMLAACPVASAGGVGWPLNQLAEFMRRERIEALRTGKRDEDEPLISSHMPQLLASFHSLKLKRFLAGYKADLENIQRYKNEIQNYLPSPTKMGQLEQKHEIEIWKSIYAILCSYVDDSSVKFPPEVALEIRDALEPLVKYGVYPETFKKLVFKGAPKSQNIDETKIVLLEFIESIKDKSFKKFLENWINTKEYELWLHSNVRYSRTLKKLSLKTMDLAIIFGITPHTITVWRKDLASKTSLKKFKELFPGELEFAQFMIMRLSLAAKNYSELRSPNKPKASDEQFRENRIALRVSAPKEVARKK